MFKIQTKPKFWAKVPISIPGSDKPADLDVEYKWFGRGELIAYDEETKGREDLDNLTDIIVDWKIEGVPYSRDALESFLDQYPGAALDLYIAFRREHGGAKAKNSKP